MLVGYRGGVRWAYLAFGEGVRRHNPGLHSRPWRMLELGSWWVRAAENVIRTSGGGVEDLGERGECVRVAAAR